MGKYASKNAEVVLSEVRKYIAALEDASKLHVKNDCMVWKGCSWNASFKIEDVYEQLSIFDWWDEYLSKSQLKKMEDFLVKAIELGYTGYVCFKVGAKYCAHGMWAHKEESTDGYSPDGGCLFRGFRSGDYNQWDACTDDGTWLHEIVEEVDDFTFKQVKNMLAAVA